MKPTVESEAKETGRDELGITAESEAKEADRDRLYTIKEIINFNHAWSTKGGPLGGRHVHIALNFIKAHLKNASPMRICMVEHVRIASTLIKQRGVRFVQRKMQRRKKPWTRREVHPPSTTRILNLNVP
ncbi:hypothetical protein EYC80_000199 [Monilinia laxa]|uniref:Uncharacterized protein n=1 Tax=Monilinia laxa TaxID=61186 RepID=A0A5N6K9U1_MONLA|nr:hypothetical protein EYC80_000199 [Monilinia laxa]